MVLRHQRKEGRSGRENWWRMSHVRYANEPAVRKAGSAQRLCGLKMADGENSLGKACSGGPEMEEPAPKRPRTGPVTKSALKVAEADKFSCVSADAGSWESAANRAQPAEKEAKPAMAVEQAPAAQGGDNNGLGLLVSERHRPAGKRHDGVVLGATQDDAGTETAARLTRLECLRGARRPAGACFANLALTGKLC